MHVEQWDGQRTGSIPQWARTGGAAVALAVAGFVLTMVISVVAGFGLAAAGVTVTDPTAPPVFLTGTAAGSVAFAVVGGGYLAVMCDHLPIGAPDREDVGLIVGSSVVAIVLGLALTSAIQFVTPEPVENVFGNAASGAPWVYLAMAALSVVLIAPAEELLFRGAIQGRIRAQYGAIAAIGGASVPFMLFHVPNYLASLPVAILGASAVGVISVILGVVYERSGTLWAPIAVHALYNVALFGLAYLSVTGML
ncbi:CPBP family intramembrane glutamic endopeptidase [Halococcoides cellulosivorans]|uniref:CAAX prenyl protease 2/Lysostaphin resistance protein A-like domain-containing protein n=1 Tax=Halococcoides cellulosivorans TaxID=1679096 RepID=A0A2R4X438_9EURY|nr:CPBP family intramembrane glutamic endopeptidase [Halococcoides cellulosivorans]AWB28565.1 hypothetical protein HARCEL1_13180 [Halococcoides cellulosivorans]